MKKRELLWKLFFSTFYLSAFTFGGGYVIVTLMKKKFVDQYHWIEEQEMLDLIAIAQSAPGAIAVNGSIVLGYKLAGIVGALVTVTATILPPFAIISVLSLFYTFMQENIWFAKLLEGMQAGVGAVIASTVYDMARGIVTDKSRLSIFIMICSFIALSIFGVNVIFVVLACAGLGVVKTIIEKKRRKK